MNERKKKSSLNIIINLTNKTKKKKCPDSIHNDNDNPHLMPLLLSFFVGLMIINPHHPMNDHF